MIENKMAYYAMHTNYDVLGMADLAADKLMLGKSEVLEETSSTTSSSASSATYIFFTSFCRLPANNPTLSQESA